VPTADNTATAPGAVVAWVPVHPKNGPLWSMTTDKPDPARLPSYPLRALVFSDGAAVDLEALEQRAGGAHGR
jgi:hypothetical protein